MQYYAVGAHFPATTRGIYGESNVSLATEWYLQPWNLRPTKGYAPKLSTRGEFALDSAVGGQLDPNEDQTKTWFQSMHSQNQ